MQNAARSTPRESGLSGPAIARQLGRDRTTVCLDLWDTTACPPDAPETDCDGKIRGSTGLLPTGGWERTGGPTVCNAQFLRDTGTVQHTLNFLFSVQDDSVKANRQNHLIVHMHDPLQVLRIPILDDD